MSLETDSGISTDNEDVQVTKLLRDFSLLTPSGRGVCRGSIAVLQDGVEVMQLAGRCDEPLDIPIVDDSNRICFSFNHCLNGRAVSMFRDGNLRELEVRDGAGSIQYCPGRRGVYRQVGTLRNVTVMVRPDVFASWAVEMDQELGEVVKSGGFLEGHRGGELLAATQLLDQALAGVSTGPGAAGARHPLWLQAQGMKVVSLFLEARGAGRAPDMSDVTRIRLMRARDLLLADLGHTPSLPEIAREAGLSAPTLTRGFRRLFGETPYGLYQRERMLAAHERLLSGSDSITTVAADLGYSNPSHFSTAFRKQFGVLPSNLRRRA